MHLEVVHREGLVLSKLYNLPHKSLGMLYYAHIKQPWREDYLKDYLIAYFEAADGGYLQEGQKRPMIDMYAVNAARSFPRSPDLWQIRCIVMENHEKWLNDRK